MGRRARDFRADPDVDPSEIFCRWKMSMATGTVLATQDWGNGPIDITPELLTTWLVEHIMKDITVDLGVQGSRREVPGHPGGRTRGAGGRTDVRDEKE